MEDKKMENKGLLEQIRAIENKPFKVRPLTMTMVKEFVKEYTTIYNKQVKMSRYQTRPILILENTAEVEENWELIRTSSNDITIRCSDEIWNYINKKKERDANITSNNY